MQKFLKNYVVIIIFVLFFVIASFMSPYFFTKLNLTNILLQNSMVIIVGCAVTMLMISKGLDLSIGSIVALSAMTLAKLVGHGTGFPLVPAIIIAILVGGLAGALNAFIVVRLGVNHIITTLGTMYVFRGIVFVLSQSQTIGSGFPKGYEFLGQGYLWIIPIPVIIMIIVIGIFIFIQNRTLLGKYSYAIGSNEKSALLAGVPVKKTKSILLILTGLFGGVAGVIMTSRSMSGGPLSASGLEFDVILAVLLGGTSLEGGEGKIRGVVFGALVLGIVRNSMNLIGLPRTYQYIVTGAIFIFAIILNKIIKGERIGS
jgi:ribose transport system permease protein